MKALHRSADFTRRALDRFAMQLAGQLANQDRTAANLAAETKLDPRKIRDLTKPGQDINPTVALLAAVADGLDCELVITLVPRV